jgi:hypothetical protein
MIPGSPATEEGKRHSIDRSSFQTERAGRHFQSHPLTCTPRPVALFLRVGLQTGLVKGSGVQTQDFSPSHI